MFALKNKKTGKYVAISYDDNDCPNAFKLFGKDCASYFYNASDARNTCKMFGKNFNDFKLVDYPED